MILMTGLNRLLGIAMLMASISPSFAEDKIFQKGEATPVVGVILKVDDTTVQIQLPSAVLPIARNKIDRVEVPQPANFVQATHQIEEGKAQEGIAVLEPLYQNTRACLNHGLNK